MQHVRKRLRRERKQLRVILKEFEEGVAYNLEEGQRRRALIQELSRVAFASDMKARPDTLGEACLAFMRYKDDLGVLQLRHVIENDYSKAIKRLREDS